MRQQRAYFVCVKFCMQVNEIILRGTGPKQE
jgi:hypothetical protein